MKKPKNTLNTADRRSVRACRFGSLVAALALSGPLLLADDFTWTGASNGLNWTGTSNWSNPDDKTAAPVSVDDTAIFGSIGGSSRILNLDSDVNIGVLKIGFADAADAVNNSKITLTTSSSSPVTLAVGDDSTPGGIYVGWTPSTNSAAKATGTTLEIGTGVMLALHGGSFLAGGGKNDTAAGITINGGALALGSATNRSVMKLGYGERTLNSSSTQGGYLVANASNGGSLTAWLSTLSLGLNTSTSSPLYSARVHSTYADLTNFTTATIDTNALQIGVSTNGVSVTRTTGTLVPVDLTLGSHSLTANNDVQIGVSAGLASQGVYNAGNNEAISRVSGALAASADSHITFGSADTRAAVQVGVSTNTRGIVNLTHGEIKMTGGEFTGYLSALTIGSNTGANYTRGEIYEAVGSVDLRAATVAVFDVSGDVKIGYSGNESEGSIGSLYLPAVAGAIGGNLYIGDSTTGGATKTISVEYTTPSSSGLARLEGTQLEVGGDVTIGKTGRIEVVVTDSSAGLFLSATSNLIIAENSEGYVINFDNATAPADTGVLYGLAWEGNHGTVLSGLVGSGLLTWTDTADLDISVRYNPDLNLTYVGIGPDAPVPEPATLAALLGALVLAAAAIIRRR
jgi:hypothetical protein